MNKETIGFQSGTDHDAATEARDPLSAWGRTVTPRERTMATLAHRQPDRVPIGFDAHDGLLQRLLSHYGVADQLSLFKAMGIDGFSVFCESYVHPRYVGPPLQQLGDGNACDFWGIDSHQRHLPFGGYETVADLDQYAWPTVDWFDYSGIRERCDAIHALGLPTVGGEGGCGIQHAINLRGYEQALMDPLVDPAFTHAYMERLGDFFVAWNERWLAAAEGQFDIYRCGDEIGANDRMHCSPEIWREFYKPQLRRIFAVAKRHGLKIWFHCCGVCRPVLEDLIEIGVDLWDPVPGYVAGNDQAELKHRYGDRLAFIGGVDTVTILRHGSVRDVRDEVKRCLDIFAPGGGYILGGSQVLLDNLPLANVVAMFEAAVELGRY
jgi:uroporphyrinogen decarboxylase